MRVPFPFEVRRGWETGDSVSSWGVHGGAIQVGGNIYKCEVAETLGDGRRWQPIDDPDDLLTENPLECTIFAGVVGGFVVFSTDPDMVASYVTPIAKLEGVRIVQLAVGNIRFEDGAGDQFRVSSIDGISIQVRGGVWQIIYTQWNTASSDWITSTYAVTPTDDDISWGGVACGYDLSMSVPYSPGGSAVKTLWAHLVVDKDSPAGAVFTVESLVGGSDPSWAVKNYWIKIADIAWSGGEVTSIQQYHTGAIHTALYTPVDVTVVTAVKHDSDDDPLIKTRRITVLDAGTETGWLTPAELGW